MKSLKKMFTGRMFKAGSYSTFAAVIVIAIAVAVNMVCSALPSTATQFDLTANNIFTLSDQTRRIVSSLDQPVTLSLIATTGQEDATVTKLLDRYKALSSKVTVAYVDPATQPTFLKQFDDIDQDKLYANSVMVQSGDRHRFVSYADILVTDYSMNYSTYSYDTTQTFNGEQELTSAIHYVTSDTLPKVYTLTGHGEGTLSDTIQDAMKAENLESDTLSLLTAESVPEDASAVVIYAPSSDLNENEAQLLIDFIGKGGGVVLLTDYTDPTKIPNLLKVTSAMGVTLADGMIVEGDMNMCLRGYAHYLVPTINTHDITQPLIDSNYPVLLPLAQAITKTGEGSATVTALLSTSSSSYAKLAGLSMTTYDKEDGDTDGPFDIGVACEDGEGHFVWFSAAQMLEDNVNNMVSGGNSDLFINSLNWMCEQEEAISIRSKSMDNQTLTVPTAQNSFWSTIMIGIIPAALLALGIVIWYRRKRK